MLGVIVMSFSGIWFKNMKRGTVFKVGIVNMFLTCGML